MRLTVPLGLLQANRATVCSSSFFSPDRRRHQLWGRSALGVRSRLRLVKLQANPGSYSLLAGRGVWGR